MSLVSIIIPVHNKWELSANCLRSLAEHTPSTRLEIILVDNASADETQECAPVLGRELFGSAFHYLRQEENINFGPACNLAANKAQGDLLFFLNNDTLVTPGWLPPLLRAMGKPGTAGAGPLLAYADDSVQHLGVGIAPAGLKVGHIYTHLPIQHPLAQKKRSFAVITAAALLLPRHKFLTAGAFCEEFINGFEDVDLCLRLAQGGEVMRVEPESLVYHLESQTPRRHDSDLHNSRLLLSRWDLSAFSNLEDIAEADGYELKVDPTLRLLFSPAQQRLPGLLKALRGPGGLNVVALWDLLQEEPYWEEGYAMLGQSLEGAGHLEQAFAIHHQCLLFNPSLAAQERQMRCAKLLAAQGHLNKDELQALEQSWQGTQSLIQNQKQYEAELATTLKVLQHRGKEALATQYEAAAQQAKSARQAWELAAQASS